MKQQQIDIQNVFLNEARKLKMPVTVFLMNGVPIKGLIKNFDAFTLEIESGGKQQVVYKHAISTIVPLKTVNIKAAAQ